MYSVTLQSSDSVITTGDVLGRVNFAASDESSGSASILIVGSMRAEADSAFTNVSNETSIILATASADASSAVDRLKIAGDGTITFNQAYTFPAADGSANQVLQTDGAGNISFATAGGGGISNVVEDTSPQLGGNLEVQNHEISGVHAIELVNNTFDKTPDMLYSNSFGSYNQLHFNSSGIPYSEPVNGNNSTSGVLNFMITDQVYYDSITPDANTVYFIV